MANNPILQAMGSKPQIDPAIIARAREIMAAPQQMNALMQAIGGRNVEGLARALAKKKGIDIDELMRSLQ